VNRKTLIFLVVVLGCLASVAFGFRYWLERREAFMGRMEKPPRFLLVTLDGPVFDSSKSSLLPLQLYVFAANDITKQDMTEFTDFWKKFNRTWGSRVELIFVSRIGSDLLYNFKSITKFPGRILSDPTGTSGRLLGFWPNVSQDDGWHYVLLAGKDATRVWSYDAPQGAPFSEVHAKLKSAIADSSAK
jgi:hypothetical protein